MVREDDVYPNSTPPRAAPGQVFAHGARILHQPGTRLAHSDPQYYSDIHMRTAFPAEAASFAR